MGIFVKQRWVCWFCSNRFVRSLRLSKRRYTLFFISNTFISNARLKLGKNQGKAKQQPEAELLLFETYSLSIPTLSYKNSWRYSKNLQKTSSYVCLSKVIKLMAIKMRLEMKNRSHRYDITRPRPRHGHKYTTYKICLSLMMAIFIKQYLSNI